MRQRLLEMGIEQPTATDVGAAICAIRREKLPDPAELGNAGSFFKNPVVPQALAERIRAEHADLVAYPAGEGMVKLAAGWLIDKAGWKGFRDGDAGVHRQQALVLVNYGQVLDQRVSGHVFSALFEAAVRGNPGIRSQALRDIDAFRQMGRDLLDGKGWDDRR